MSVILVHLTTCGRNSELAEQWAVGTAVRHLILHINIRLLVTIHPGKNSSIKASVDLDGTLSSLRKFK